MSRRSRKPEQHSLFSPRCEECGEYLIRLESGLLSCPQGHGKLVEGVTDLFTGTVDAPAVGDLFHTQEVSQ